MDQTQTIRLKVSSADKVTLKILGEENSIKLGMEQVRPVPMDIYPVYDGETDIYPSSMNQILETEDTVLKNDITVHAISYTEIDNEFGGKTAIIAG